MPRAPVQPTPSSKVRVRGIILTTGITAITIVGVWFGAGLKTQQETKAIRKKAATDDGQDELLAALQTRRRGLVQAKTQWEQKAAALRARTPTSSSSGDKSAASGK